MVPSPRRGRAGLFDSDIEGFPLARRWRNLTRTLPAEVRPAVWGDKSSNNGAHRRDPLVAVFGATGAHGDSLARTIPADPDRRFDVRTVTPRPGSPAACPFAQSGAEIVRGDLDDAASAQRVMKGADAAFCTTNVRGHCSPEKEPAAARARPQSPGQPGRPLRCGSGQFRAHPLAPPRAGLAARRAINASRQRVDHPADRSACRSTASRPSGRPSKPARFRG